MYRADANSEAHNLNSAPVNVPSTLTRAENVSRTEPASTEIAVTTGPYVLLLSGRLAVENDATGFDGLSSASIPPVAGAVYISTASAPSGIGGTIVRRTSAPLIETRRTVAA